MNPIEIEKNIRALEATGVRCSGNPSLPPARCCAAGVKFQIDWKQWGSIHNVTGGAMAWSLEDAKHAVNRALEEGWDEITVKRHNAPHELPANGDSREPKTL